MNFEDNITEVFDRYLTGQMTEVEEREFEQQLQNDAALNQAYQMHRTIVAGIREARKEELKDYIKQNAKIRYIGNVWSAKWVMTSAAVLVIVFSAYFVIEYAMKSASKNKMVEAVTEGIDSNEQTDNEAIVLADSQTTATDSANKGLKNEEGNTMAYEDATAPKKAAKKTVPVFAEADYKTEQNKVLNSKNANTTIDVYYINAENSSTYVYNKSKLTLYNVPYNDNIALYKTSNTDYLTWRNKYYPLIADDKAHTLQELIDDKIIKQLPALQ